MRRSIIVVASVFGALTTGGGDAAGSMPPSVRTRVDRLIKIVKRDRSFKLRALAARRLGAAARDGAARDPKILRTLVDCLSDRNSVVRGVCAQALGLHGDPSTLPALERVAERDGDRIVRRAAERAAALVRPARRLVATKRTRRLTVQLGRVEFAPGESNNTALLRSIRSAVEDRIEPHMPAMMPREDPDLRIDVSVSRESVGAARGQDIRYEVRVVLVELPGANLRTTSQAIATTRGARRSKKRMVQLEERIALEAVHRAVDEVLVALN